MDRRHLSVIGGILIHLVLGTVYISGNIEVYIVSYFRYLGENLTLQDANYLMTVQFLGKNASEFLGSWLCIKYGSYMEVLISPVITGNAIIVFSILISSFCESFWLFIVFYGFFYGLGTGFSVISIQYVSVLLVGWEEFPTEKPKITGLIVAGYGFGGSIFNIVSSYLINPEGVSPNIHESLDGISNSYYSKDIAGDLPCMLRWLSLIYFLMSLTGIYLLGNMTVDDPKTVEPVCPEFKEISYWRLYFGSLFSIAGVLYLASVYKNFGEGFIEDDLILTVLGSVSSIFNGIFRFIWAYFMQKTSFRTVYILVLGIEVFLLASIYYIVFSKILYFIWVSLLFSCLGGHFSLCSSLHGELYGPGLGGKLYGIFYSNFGLGGLMIYFIELYTLKYTGYEILFWLVSGFSLISLINILTFHPKKYEKSTLSEKLI